MNSVALYKKKLKKHLPCKSIVKKRLLENFQTSLDEFLEDLPSPTAQELNAAFGPPEEMVKILSAEISQKETDSYRKSQKIKKVLSAILAVAFLLVVLYVFFWKSKPIVHTEDITIIDDVTAPRSTAGGK